MISSPIAGGVKKFTDVKKLGFQCSKTIVVVTGKDAAVVNGQ